MIKFILVFLALLPNLLFASSLDMTNCGDCNKGGQGGLYPPPQQQQGGNRNDRKSKKTEDNRKYEPGKVYRARTSVKNWKEVHFKRTAEHRQTLSHIYQKQDKPDPDNLLDIAETALRHAEDANNAIPDDYRTEYDDDGHTDYSSIYNTIARTLIDTFDKGTSLVPIASEARDIIEAVTGKNIITHEELSTIDRTIAIIGAATLGFSDMPLKAIKALGVVAQETHIFTSGYRAAQESFAPAFKAAQELLWKKPISELKETLNFIKKWDIKFIKETKTDWINSFFKGAKVEVLKEDTIAFRYFTEGWNSPRANWLTNKLIDLPQAQAELALKYPPQNVKKWIIPKGTELMQSKAAPKYDQIGGGFQYYIPDPSVLREVM